MVRTANKFVIVYFNSIKVQLEQINPNLDLRGLLNFNSIKVQLEPGIASKCRCRS